MNQIMDLYEGNEEFTSTERDLLLDYALRIAGEVRKINILSDSEEITTASSSLGHIKSTNVHVAQFTPIDRTTPVVDAATSNPKPDSQPMDANAYNDLFDHLEVHDVYSKLALKPLKDIREGMGLNEKIVAQNELFNGDKQAFEEVIQQLNQSADFQAARMFLCQSVIPRFNWTDASKEKTVNSFIKLVKRRHL